MKKVMSISYIVIGVSSVCLGCRKAYAPPVAINIYSGVEIPIYAVVPDTGPPPILGFSASGVACVDCTLRGTNKRPDFWQDAEPGFVY